MNSSVFLEWFLQATWTNALLATVAAGLIAVLARRVRRPGLRHALWLFVILQLLSPPLLRWSVLPSALPVTPPLGAPIIDIGAKDTGSLPSGGASSPVAAPATRSTSIPMTGVPHLERVVPLMVFAAGLVSCFLLILAVIQAVRLERRARQGVADPALDRRVQRLADRLGLTRRPIVRIIDAPLPPMIWAPWPTCPQLLLPMALLERLDDPETDAVLLHELAHLARRDHWVRWVEMLATALYWWHPVLWLARRALRSHEERAADDLTIATRPDLAPAYARSLLTTLDFLRRSGAPRLRLATPSDPRHDLEERLTMIMKPHETALVPNRLHRNLRRGLVGLGALALLVVPVQAGSGDDPHDETLRTRIAQLEAESKVMREEREALRAQLRALENERRVQRTEASELAREMRAAKRDTERRKLKMVLEREQRVHDAAVRTAEVEARREMAKAERIAREAAREHETGEATRLEQMEQQRAALEMRIAQRLEAREVKRLALEQTRRVQEERRQSERLERHTSRRVTERTIRRHEGVDSNVTMRLRSLVEKLRTLRDRTTSEQEATSLNQQLEDLQAEIARLEGEQ